MKKNLDLIEHCFLEIYFQFLQGIMNLMNQKYRNLTASLLTAFYMFSLLAAIFHYHHIELLSDHSIDTSSANTSNHYQIIFDSNHACIVQHNLTNLQTSLVLLTCEHQQIHSENINFRNDTDGFYAYQFVVNDNLLRAPPSFS